jgi:hypothetical protein
MSPKFGEASDVFVDLREEKVFYRGHIEGARNVTQAALKRTVSEISLISIYTGAFAAMWKLKPLKRSYDVELASMSFFGIGISRTGSASTRR